MGTPLLIAVTLAYGWVAVDFYLKGDISMAWVFAGYVLANGGFIHQALKVGGGL